MTEKFPAEGKPEARFVSIKEVFKMIASDKLSTALKKTFNPTGNSPLVINVNFDYEDDNEECAPL